MLAHSPIVPADSLQPNSNLLQRNSNITAGEFQQFHSLCCSYLFCSRGDSRRFATFGGESRLLAGFITPKFHENKPACAELIFSSWLSGARKLLQNQDGLSACNREIGREVELGSNCPLTI
jgi:hypothetical protein